MSRPRLKIKHCQQSCSCTSKFWGSSRKLGPYSRSRAHSGADWYLRLLCQSSRTLRVTSPAVDFQSSFKMQSRLPSVCRPVTGLITVRVIATLANLPPNNCFSPNFRDEPDLHPCLATWGLGSAKPVRSTLNDSLCLVALYDRVEGSALLQNLRITRHGQARCTRRVGMDAEG
jgi:hypothetical protein